MSGHNQEQSCFFIPDGVKFQFVVLHQPVPRCQRALTGSGSLPNGAAGLACRQQVNLRWYRRTANSSGLFQPFKHLALLGLKFRRLAGFAGIYHPKQRREIHFIVRRFVPDIKPTRAGLQSRSDFIRKSSAPFFASPWCYRSACLPASKMSFSEWIEERAKFTLWKSTVFSTFTR